MLAYLTFPTLLLFALFCYGCSKPDGAGRTSYIVAFIALLTFFGARGLVAEHLLGGVWLITAALALGLAFLSSLKGIVKAKGAGRVPPMGAAVGLGFILFMMGGNYFGEERNIAIELQRLQDRRAEIEDRLDDGIPDFLSTLEKQADDVREALKTATPSTRVGLESELRQIARLYVAVERERGNTRNLIQRLDQELRRLERLQESQKILDEDDEELKTELDALWKQTEVALENPIDSRLDAGIADDAAVSAKYEQLLNQR